MGLLGKATDMVNKNSLEQIIYDMVVFGAEATEDKKDVVLIAETLLRLPQKTREKVLKEAIFIVADRVNGTFFETNVIPDLIKGLLSTGKVDLMKKDSLIKLSMILELSVKQSFILLNFANMRKDSKITKISTTAHEIAHFILGNTSGRRNQERNADDLVEEWGFRRAYENYSAFRCDA